MQWRSANGGGSASLGDNHHCSLNPGKPRSFFFGQQMMFIEHAACIAGKGLNYEI
jgi:hypothetical protein